MPTARPIIVEWSPEYTLWPQSSSSGRTYGSVGVVVHADDTYLEVTGEKSEDGIGSGYVHVYHMDKKGEYRTYTCGAAPVEYTDVLRYVDHLRRSQAALQQLGSKHFSKPELATPSGPLLPIERTYNMQDRAKSDHEAGILRYNEGKHSMEAIMEQTRRYLELQEFNSETGAAPVS